MHARKTGAQQRVNDDILDGSGQDAQRGREQAQ